MRRIFPRAGLAAGLLAGALACGGDGPAALQVQRDTVGDTIIVRTLAGSAWGADARLEPDVRIGAFEGEDVYMLGDVGGFDVAPDGSIYLYDRQVPALRKYNADGEFVATLGREGGGPGEYRQSDGGVAVLPDGRVLLRDPGNARITVYSADGGYLDSWPTRGGHFTSRRLYVDTAGRAYSQIWGSTPDGERYVALQAYEPDGTLADSLEVPEWGYEAGSIEASGESVRIMNNVPFSPREHWSLGPYGTFVAGLSTEYSIDVYQHDGSVLRIQRVAAPVRVGGEEAEARRMSIIHSFRRYVPDWQWNGPPIPDAKPPFQDLGVGTDGRIWVRLHQPGYLAEAADPDDPVSVDQWQEPVVWDIFERDGTYLGQVHGPRGFETHPQPVFGTDRVWAVTTDDLDVPYLTRFRIVRGALDTGAGAE